MGQACVLTGMVLKTAPAGEYDRENRTAHQGAGESHRLCAGRKKAEERAAGGYGPVCFGKFEAYEGREAFTVVKAEISNYFRELYGDLDKTYYGCYFLEVAEYFTQPYQAEEGQAAAEASVPDAAGAERSLPGAPAGAADL